jgi:uncharacterized protein YecE (DUF72 family)
MEKQGTIYIGTSGWKYKHWNKVFYPAQLKEVDQLQYYYEHFDSVELNNSFYREPTAENFERWKKAVPRGFKYAVKANRYFTHLKKLKVTRSEIEAFLAKVMHLEECLGPVLFQLPPSWKINLERLEDFLKLLPSGIHYTFEFRNQSWYGAALYKLLTTYHCAFCIYELDGHLSPLPVTTDFVYIRLHGPGAKYQGSYDTESLMKWAKFAQTYQQQGKDVYLYFDNDQAGYAAFNALAIKKIV